MLTSHPIQAADPRSSLLVCDQAGQYRQACDEEILAAARQVLAHRVHRGAELTSPQAVRDFLVMQLGALEHEVFAVLFLDVQHRVLAYEEMFRGTVSQTAVYPREVVKAALRLNAAAVVLVHNHPSGVGEPSRADETLTHALKAALRLVDVATLDHMVVTGTGITSFAERGLL